MSEKKELSDIDRSREILAAFRVGFESLGGIVAAARTLEVPVLMQPGESVLPTQIARALGVALLPDNKNTETMGRHIMYGTGPCDPRERYSPSVVAATPGIGISADRSTLTLLVDIQHEDFV